jgi:hypothetical protein
MQYLSCEISNSKKYCLYLLKNMAMRFLDKLQILNMIPKKGGLLLVSEKDSPDITETERRILNIAEKDYKADAVYFRKFDSSRAPIPQVFIYENSNSRLSDNEKIEIHKRIWTSEIVPLYYIFENTQISIINGKRKIAITKGKESFQDTITEQLDLIHDIENQYDALRYPYKSYFFDNGSFWDTDVYKQQFITNESPFKLLISHLKELKKEISSQITEQVLNRLIVQCILIKYLEEKRDENGNNIFTVKSNLFREKWKNDTFVDVIKTGNLLNLFDYLAGYYNGKVFEWDKNTEKKERREVFSLPQDTLNYLAAYFDGNLDFKTKEFILWRFYSFQYLPVELISRIYEEFLPDMPGVVYTPSFLVDFLIDECMPIEDYEKFKTGSFKVLDPSLGSGIFCVSAYKRLIDWYRINRYYDEKKAWDESIDSDTLKSILKNNIFGTDIEKEAVRIAIFSLNLALLESLTPLQILEELHFEDLSEKNILHKNFFEFFDENKNNQSFDLVIGNPPFNPPGKIKNSDYIKDIKECYDIEFSHKIPDDNLALAFLDKAPFLSKPITGLTCLILPSAPLLYGKRTMEYRSSFIQNFFVPQIIDFTHLRRILFNKDVSTAAIFVKNQKPDINSDIWHIIANRTKKEQNRLFFLFDHYDFHVIKLQQALNEKDIWKANLLGGGRLSSIAQKISRITRTVKDYLEEKENKNNWAYADGYIVGKENKNNIANYITGYYTLPNGAFTAEGIIYERIYQETEKYFNNISNERAFLKPQILIKRTISENNVIPICKVDYEKIEKYKKTKTSFNKDKLCFKDGILGIHYDEKDNKEMELFIEYLSQKENILFMYLTSAAILVRKEGALKKTDIDSLPYPHNKGDIELNDIEKIWRDDVLSYYIHQAKSPDSNPLNNSLENTEQQIKEYGNIFCRIMDSNYKLNNNCRFQQGETIETPSYIATSFLYAEENIPFSFRKSDEKEFIEYFNKQTGYNQKITRILRYRQNDSIWFIKPRLLRYWIQSIADRDAIDCINDILMNR